MTITFLVKFDAIIEKNIKILILCVRSECNKLTTPCYSLGCAAGDNIVASDGDFTEDGQSVVGQKVQLGVPQLRM